MIIHFLFYKLRKLEFADFVRGIISIVTKNNTEELGLTPFLTSTKEKLLLVDNLQVRRRKHAKSKEIRVLRSKRNKLVSSLLSHIHSYELADLEPRRADVIIAVNHVNRLLKNFHKGTEKDRNERMVQFLELLNSNEDLKGALKNLLQDELLVQLRSVHEEISTLLKVRVSDNSKRTRLLTQKWIMELSEFLTNLFNRIDLAAIENPDKDYKKLIDELNEWSSPYIALIKGRETRKENEAKKVS